MTKKGLRKCRAVDGEENQRQVFQRRPRALGNRRRDSHIPAAPTTTAVGKWKSKPGIPTFPPLIPLSQNQKRKEISTPTCYPRLQAHLRIRKRSGAPLRSINSKGASIKVSASSF